MCNSSLSVLGGSQLILNSGVLLPWDKCDVKPTCVATFCILSHYNHIDCVDGQSLFSCMFNATSTTVLAKEGNTLYMTFRSYKYIIPELWQDIWMFSSAISVSFYHIFSNPLTYTRNLFQTCLAAFSVLFVSTETCIVYVHINQRRFSNGNNIY